MLENHMALEPCKLPDTRHHAEQRAIARENTEELEREQEQEPEPVEDDEEYDAPMTDDEVAEEN